MESSAPFSEERGSFHRNGLLDRSALWLAKAAVSTVPRAHGSLQRWFSLLLTRQLW